MPSFRNVREFVLLAHSSGYINGEEFVLLWDAYKSRNPEFPYWNYERFDLDEVSEAECKAEFRFFRSDIYALADALRSPDEIVTYNGLVPALCILLKRFAYPCRFEDMVPRPVPELCIITNHMVDLVYNQLHHLITRYNHDLLSSANLVLYADAVHRSGAGLDNCWVFIDGTVRAVCRPDVNQRAIHNGHKRVHFIKFQSVALPNGLVGNMYGPVEGKRHDSGMLASSGFLQELQRFSLSPITGLPMCVYGDPAYPLRVHLQAPYRGAALTQQQTDFNKSMSAARVSVEWVFGDIVNFVKFLDFKKNLKIGLSAVGKMYLVCAILQNARTILYKSVTSEYFGIDPPPFDQYFI